MKFYSLSLLLDRSPAILTSDDLEYVSIVEFIVENIFWDMRYVSHP